MKQRSACISTFCKLSQIKLKINRLTKQHSFSKTAAIYRDNLVNDLSNDSSAAILSMVPPMYHKYFVTKSPFHVNQSVNQTSTNGSTAAVTAYIERSRPLTIDEMRRNIARYNDLQTVLNEDLFGPLQSDSVIIVVQVSWKLSELFSCDSFFFLWRQDVSCAIRIRSIKFTNYQFIVTCWD